VLIDQTPNLVQFYYSILVKALDGLRRNFFQDNFDTERFGFDGVDRSVSFDTQSSAFYFDWFSNNKSDLYRAFMSLEDNNSRNLFMDLIAFRMAGHLSIKIQVPWRNDPSAYEAYKKLEKHVPRKLDLKGLLGSLRHYDFECEGNRYIADCGGFEWTLFRRQYYYEENGVSVKPEPGDVVIDGGACLGEATLTFSNTVGSSGAVFAFDLVADHLRVLEHNLNTFTHKNVVLMPWGLSDRDVDAQPIVLDKYDAGFRVGDQHLPLRRIDSLIDKGLEKIDFIKLDIEGSELECLVGAETTISKFRPKLAISLYHKPDDLFTIINYLHDKYAFYKFHLGHYTIHQEETVLYCNPQST